jgi:hypothetical protein
VDRSHFILAAAVLLAGLAIVQVLRDDEPAPLAAPAPTEASEVAAAPPPVESAGSPGERVAPAPRSLLVHGEVTSSRGDRVPGARIAVRGGRADEGVTNASGAYELRLERSGSEAPVLRFSAAGYQDAIVELEPASLAGEQLRIDVQLEPAPGATVSGVLTSERGSPIAGETIQLTSAASNARHAALTGADGRFFIPGVQPGPGYYLFVRPQSGYGDYQQAVDIGPDGLSHDIALRELSTARLRGRLVDTEGRPIPNLELSVVSGQALGKALPTTSDAEGYFVVDGVPTGYLNFLAHAPEKLAISGVRLSPGSDAEVVLRADWGDEALRGRVVDEAGRPLAGAEVELSWSHVSEGSAGRSNRSAVTDASGSFEFRRLGDGIHRLDVRAPGHQEVQLDYEVTPQSPGVEVQLEPVRGAG